MDLGLSKRVALVAGSSRGLGLAIATTLAGEGCRVVLNGRDAERLSAAVRSVRDATAAEVDGVTADVSVPSEAGRLVERAAARFGTVDILVCNAGGPPSGTLATAPADAWQAALDLNLLSTVHLCRAAVPGMRERRWGRVICLTSVAAKQPLGSLTLSTTARAAVLGFAKCLADEVARDGVTVNSVCPGYMHTERVEQLVAERAQTEQRSRDDVVTDIVAHIPMGRMGEPRELASVVAFLASEPAGYITGVALAVDGGIVRSIL